MIDPEDLLGRSPVGMTQREMLLRLDARLDTFDRRVRAVEDEQLASRIERKTIMSVVGSLRSTILAAAAVGPIIAGVIAIASNHGP